MHTPPAKIPSHSIQPGQMQQPIGLVSPLALLPGSEPCTDTPPALPSPTLSLTHNVQLQQFSMQWYEPCGSHAACEALPRHELPQLATCLASPAACPPAALLRPLRHHRHPSRCCCLLDRLQCASALPCTYLLVVCELPAGAEHPCDISIQPVLC